MIDPSVESPENRRPSVRVLQTNQSPINKSISRFFHFSEPTTFVYIPSSFRGAAAIVRALGACLAGTFALALAAFV